MNLNHYFCNTEQIYTMSASIILAHYHIARSEEFIVNGPIDLWPYSEEELDGLEIRLNYRSYEIIKWVQAFGDKIVDTPNPYRINSDRIYSVMLR